MALTKSNTQVENALTLTAGAGDDTGATQDLTGSYSGETLIKLTNGATGPTDPAEVEVFDSGDGSKWYSIAKFKGGTDNNGIYSTKVPYGLGTMYRRTVQGSNTGQNVTLDIDNVKVPSL